MNNNRTDRQTPGNPVSNDRGMILVVALWILVFMASLGLATNLVARVDLGISGNYKNETDAFYLADAGLERALGKINTIGYWAEDLADPMDAFAGDNTQLMDGTYTVQVYVDDPDTKMIRIVSTGQVNDTTTSSSIEAVLTTVDFEIDGYASFSCGFIELTSHDNLILNGPAYSAGTFDIGGNGTYIVNGTAMALGRLKVMDEGWVGGDVLSNDLIKIIGSPNSEYDDDDPYTPHSDPNGDGFMINPAIVMGDAVAGTTYWPTPPGVVFGDATSGNGPTVPDLCDPEVLTKTTYTHQMIKDYIAHPRVTYTTPLVLRAGDTDLMGGGVVLVKSNMRVEEPVEYDRDLVIVVTGNFNLKASLVPNPDPGARDQNPTVAVYVPYKGVVNLQGDGTTLNGFVQAGAVSEVDLALSGQQIYVSPTTVIPTAVTVNGYLQALNAQLRSGSSGALTVNYMKIDNDETLSRYAIGQWHKL